MPYGLFGIEYFFLCIGSNATVDMLLLEIYKIFHVLSTLVKLYLDLTVLRPFSDTDFTVVVLFLITHWFFISNMFDFCLSFIFICPFSPFFPYFPFVLSLLCENFYIFYSDLVWHSVLLYYSLFLSFCFITNWSISICIILFHALHVLILIWIQKKCRCV